MVGFEKYRNAMRMQHGFPCVRNLLADSLLNRKAFGEDPHHPGEFRNPDDVLMRNVTHIGVAIKRKGVMLTQRIKRDWPFNYLTEPAIWLTPAFCFKNSQKLGVSVISFSRKEASTQKRIYRMFNELTGLGFAVSLPA
jgi:hypothetical protein